MSDSNQCKCHGFGYLYGSEIRGWRGRPSDNLTCRDCGKPSAWQRLLYWWRGYRSNDDVIESPCHQCGGIGYVDSGGVTPWMEPINVPCICHMPPQPESEKRMFYVEIVESATEKVIKRMGPMSERQAERTADGVSINLNHADYHVQVTPRQQPKQTNQPR